MQFTKEQLIEQAREDADTWRDAAEHFSSHPAQRQYAAIRLRVAEIALAALTSTQVTDTGEHFQRGYDEGHSRGLTCGKLYKGDDQMRMHRAECVAAYKAELRGEESDE